MNNHDALIADAHWQACETCKHAGDTGCDIDSDDFKYEPIFDGFVCENYEGG